MARHILLADDSTTIHRIIKDILQRENIDVTCVENGEEALRSILESPPALVLADLTMPRMGGFELCELMKREKDFQDIPVIFLVSAFDDFNEATAARVGGAGHLNKPFDSFRLMSVVNTYLSPEPQEVATLEHSDEGEPAILEGGRGQSWRPATDDGLDAADLPEPLGLAGGEPEAEAAPDGLVSLELNESDSAVDGETVELSMTATEVIIDDEPVVEQVNSSVGAEVRYQLEAMGGAVEIERLMREVIREEVRRLLPQVVELVVRERVRELELELDATTRAKEAGRVRGTT